MKTRQFLTSTNFATLLNLPLLCTGNKYQRFLPYYILEIPVSQGNLLAELPILSTEWSVSFFIRLIDEEPVSSSILHLTTGDRGGSYDNKMPNLYRVKNTDKIQIVYDVNGIQAVQLFRYEFVRDEKTKVEIHQRYVKDGIYRVYIMVDNLEVYSTVNNDARQFHNVKIYAGNPFAQSAIAFISDFKYTNYL